MGVNNRNEMEIRSAPDWIDDYSIHLNSNLSFASSHLLLIQLTVIEICPSNHL